MIERMDKKTVNGNTFEIITYEGDHQDEYLMREVKSGQCSLFYKGILQFSWKEINGVLEGELTVYDHGKEVSRENWKGLDGKEYRYMENSKKGLELVVEGNGVIYRGGFDNVESMQREGRGMEYDKKRRRLLRYGVWKHDELFQVIQEFENDRMIEYDVDDGKENVSVLNRHPVYEGGYVFDETTSSYLRDGEGCEIEGGVAVREGKWERGELVESTNLFDCLDKKMKGNDMLSRGRSMVIHNWCEWQNVNERVPDIVIPSNYCNESEWSVNDLMNVSDCDRA